MPERRLSLVPDDNVIPMPPDEAPAEFYAWIVRQMTMDSSNAVFVVIVRRGPHVLGDHESIFDIVVPPEADDRQVEKELADAGWKATTEIAHFGEALVLAVERDGDEP